MKKTIFYYLLPLALLPLLSCGSAKKNGSEQSLKDALQEHFYIGTALNAEHIYYRDTASVAVVQEHFNAIVAENCMKSMYLQPKEGVFFFDDADKFVEFGEKNGMFITGHTLIWHSQAPKWLFVDEKGDNVSAEVLKQRMKDHITTVVSRYKGRIKGWDVVNEAILEDGSYRKSKFYEILGEEFIPLAFQYAHEADPEAELYYNDYNEWYPKKREAIADLVRSLKSRGIRIDGVGMQGHISMNSPTLDEYQATIDTYALAGVKVMVTELDMSALPAHKEQGANISDTLAYSRQMNPYTDGLPSEVSDQWTQRMAQVFKLLLDNSDKVTRVTFWGVSDNSSWKNDFPIKGRTDYPLLFDRQYKAKPAVAEIIKIAGEFK